MDEDEEDDELAASFPDEEEPASDHSHFPELSDQTHRPPDDELDPEELELEEEEDDDDDEEELLEPLLVFSMSR